MELEENNNNENENVKKLTINYDEDYDWVADHQDLILEETVSAIEYMVYEDRSINELYVMEVVLKLPIGMINVAMKIYRDDITESIKSMKEKSIESENYELAGRITKLENYIEEHGLYDNENEG